jgi:hypothetical protein
VAESHDVTRVAWAQKLSWKTNRINYLLKFLMNGRGCSALLSSCEEEDMNDWAGIFLQWSVGRKGAKKNSISAANQFLGLAVLHTFT